MALLVAALCPACSDRADSRDIVLQREFPWRVAATSGADVPSSGLVVDQVWSGQALREQWSTSRAMLAAESTGMLLSGTSFFDLDAPPGTLDTRLHHELVVRAAGTGLTRLVLKWREQDGVFNDENSVELPLPPTGDPGDVRIDLLSAMVGRAAAPVPAWRLSVVGEPGRPLGLNLDLVELRSHYAPAVASGLDLLPVARQGVRMSGLCAPVPGAVSTQLSGGVGERLVLAAALVAGAAPVTLTLEDSAGLLEPHSLVLSPDDGWTALELDLSKLAGHPATTLTLRTTGDPALLLVGDVRRMGPGNRPRPNVVLWLVDTLRSDRLGSYGYGPQTDPVLARMAAAGVRVERFYAASNWTRPSVSSLLTGVGPEVHGNQVPGQRVDATLPTLAGELGRDGYVTVSFNTNYHAGQWSGLDKGFDVQFQPRHFPRLDPPTSLTSSQIAEPLLKFLEQHRDETVFVYVHCLDPHAPYAPRAEDAATLAAAGVPGAVPPDGAPDVRLRFAQRSPAYDAEILNADRELGRLDESLSRLGLDDDTLIVFTSDHGESFAEHGSWGHWRSLHEEEVRVPWVLRWPAGLPAGRTVDVSASHADLAPTTLGLLGLPVPAAWTGRDLSADMRGEPSEAADVVHIIDTISGVKASLNRRSLAAVGGQLKLIVEVDEAGLPRPLALFDLSSDPFERQDLLGDRSAPDRLLSAVIDHLRRDAARAAASPADETLFDPERLRWLEEMGYLR